MSAADHVVLDFAAKALACRHCGATQPVAMPINVTELLVMNDAYLELHEGCVAPAELGTAEASP